MKFVTTVLFAGNILFNGTANILMKIGMKHASKYNFATFDGLVKGLLQNWILTVGMLAYVVSLGFYLFAIKNVKLSIGYPLSVSCAIILVTILSNVLLKECISFTQLTGGAIILIGIFVLTR